MSAYGRSNLLPPKLLAKGIHARIVALDHGLRFLCPEEVASLLGWHRVNFTSDLHAWWKALGNCFPPVMAAQHAARMHVLRNTLLQLELLPLELVVDACLKCRHVIVESKRHTYALPAPNSDFVL